MVCWFIVMFFFHLVCTVSLNVLKGALNKMHQEGEQAVTRKVFVFKTTNLFMHLIHVPCIFAS